MNEIQDRIMGEAEVLQVSTMSASAIRRAIQRGEFPQPIKLGLRAKGWRASDIQWWLVNLEPVGSKGTGNDPAHDPSTTSRLIGGLQSAGPKGADNEDASNSVAQDLSTNSRMVGE